MLDWFKKAAWFSLAILLVFLAIVCLFVPFNSMTETDIDAESPIIQKYSTKGLYMGPSYHVKMLNGDGYDVSKKEMYQLQIGDTYGTQKNSSIKNAIKLGVILYPVSLFILWVAWLIFSGTFPELKLVQWVYKKEEAHEGKLKYIKEIAIKIIIPLFVVISMIIFALIGKNVFYKIYPVGKEEVMAEIVDVEQENKIVPNAGVREINTFALQFEDHTGTTYETEKDVSSFTYDLYRNEQYIPITYRTNHPYDIFIHSNTFREILSVLMRLDSFALFLVIYLNYYTIKTFIKKRRDRYIR
ncbi:hypothetical protein [Oceanobacillus sp. J11TS1]|uniref:hypothetical protein n=1 Tax=Oceanobacillus sp. J11TS1 TaxID=2807191 RepID=UPI001B2DF8DB|nr:hypothetical protein [Oceanobacillus sp. J11TS1]GIO23034.1 hypothetical protein J11TS1_16150 [Oceanobacillus sp. J11TS1]